MNDNEIIRIYTIAMPLIPGYKTAVAAYARNPKNGITGGFIRWNSMDTLFLVRLECCLQGDIDSIEKCREYLSTLAKEMWKYEGVPAINISLSYNDRTTRRGSNLSTTSSSSTSSKVRAFQTSPALSTQSDNSSSNGERYLSFSLGSTPKKVMDIWRKHRYDLKRTSKTNI